MLAVRHGQVGYNLSMQLAVRSNGTFFSPGGDGFRLALHGGGRLTGVSDALRRRAYYSVDWLDLAYAAKSAQEGSEYMPVPGDVAWTQLEHYEVVIDVWRGAWTRRWATIRPRQTR